MRTLFPSVSNSLKPLAKKVVPYPARLWMRTQQQRLTAKQQELKERFIIRNQKFENREGFLNFNFTLSATGKKKGVSALLRVKNEESKIHHCLSSIYDLFDEIVLVDNGSTDGTMEIVRNLKRQEDRKDKIKIYSYPFKLARLGPEHFDTPEDSVHIISYYYNWVLSQCSRKYVCKWDGDMVLRKEIREPFREFLQRIQKGPKRCWILYGQTIYRDLEGNYHLAKGEINGEIEIFPNGFNPRFYKHDLFEFLNSDPPLEVGEFDGVVFYELKFVNTDEFSHWSITDIPTERKQRELDNFQLVKRNNTCGARFEKLPSSFLDEQIG